MTDQRHSASDPPRPSVAARSTNLPHKGGNQHHSQNSHPPVWAMWLGVLWMGLFLTIFLQQPLPNAGIDRRLDVVPLLPFAVMDAIDPPQEENSAPRGWGFLPERLPLWGLAAFIALTAWSVGRLATEVLDHTACTALEQFYFRLLIGLGLLPVFVLGLGLLGSLSSGVFWLVHLICIVAALTLEARSWRAMKSGEGQGGLSFATDHGSTGIPRDTWIWMLACAPFLIGMALGSLSPSTDFDVNEYHLGGPKEWFLAGRIQFLSHNIYTSFPFLTEMLLLDAMVLSGDWFWGGVAGQSVLLLYAPLTALGIYTVGARWFTPRAGAMGAFVFLSTPWVFRMSIIAYTEGALTAYVMGTVVAGLLWTQRASPASSPAELSGTAASIGPLILAGLCAGGAMASKYTGLVMAVLPLMVWVAVIHGQADASTSSADNIVSRSPATITSRWRSLLWNWTLALLAVNVLVGPWLLKNLAETGNPVYPLGYSIFGGRDLDDAMAEKWRRGHARPAAGSVIGEARDFGVKLFDVAAVNDWQSALLFACAPLAFLWTDRRRIVLCLIIWTAWLFCAWWLFTHHLDRFWTPLLPTAAALAGVGVASLTALGPRRVGTSLVMAASAYHLGFVSTGLVGYNAGLTRLDAAADFASRITGPEIAWMNSAWARGELPSEMTVLCVGEAELFYARFPYHYNTVFDRSLFEEWFGVTRDHPVAGDVPVTKRPLRPVAEIRAELESRGITHVFVNWAEILRYRQPGSYGYPDFVHPSRFRELQALSILGPAMALPENLGRQPIGDIESANVQLARQWAPELITDYWGQPALITGQIFPVISAP